ncbi:cytochrome P450 2J5-like [Amphiura filiformis]|uniref:cytochrome P450 2J5-like n=1 Tax=Amphiura filiformis TaxID=82378 RepID=UPI003B21F278
MKMAALQYFTDYFNFKWTCVLIVMILALHYLTQRGKKTPPGPWTFPIFGSFPVIAVRMLRSGSLTQPHQFFASLSKVYGSMYSFSVFGQQIIILNDYASIKEAFHNQHLNDRPTTPFTMKVGGGPGVLMTSGDLWKQQRKFSLSALRSMGVGKSSFEDQISRETGVLITELSKKTGQVFDPRKLIVNAVSNVICSVVFGKQYSYDDPEFRKLLEIAERHIQLVGAGGAQAFVKVLQYLPTKTNRELIKNADRMEQFVQKHIDEHRSQFDPDDIRDYTDVYLEEIRLHKERGEVLHLKEDNVRGAVNNVFGAGVETTSTTLRWAFLYMITHPEIQKRIQDEIDSVIGRNRLPRLSDRNNLPFTMATISEIQRHASILFLGFPHSAARDTKLCGYDVSEGAMIISNLWAIHHDPDFWQDPETFNPDRFIDSDGNVQQHEEHLIPFSIGRRACLGENLAKMELFLFFSHLLHQFSFEKSDGQTYSLVGNVGLTYTPQTYQFKAVKRN